MRAATRLVQVLLLACGPFYCYPWKPLLNAAAGDGYEVAYEHFVAGHRSAVNLALHSVCLLVQVFGNFSFLALLDARWLGASGGGVGAASATTAAVWALFLLCTSGAARVPYSLASAAVLWVAHQVGSVIAEGSVSPWDFERAAFGTFYAVLVLSNLAAPRVRPKEMAKAAAVLAVYHCGSLWAAPLLKGSGGAVLPAALGLQLVSTAALRNPVRPLVITAAFTTRAAYLMTGDALYFFGGYAFVGSLLQGIAHEAVREEATLLHLENEGCEEAKVAFESAHVCYFPNLVLNAVVDAARRAPAERKNA